MGLIRPQKRPQRQSQRQAQLDPEVKHSYQGHGNDGQPSTKNVCSFLAQRCRCPAGVCISQLPSLQPEKDVSLVLASRI